ncbi:P protein-like [Stegodyphus dumicola]|uniref:P protein-like n=1 Tax=Stegodyphus dumicola TaxID=202533 RepID=UPI0015AC95FF|nr:P protein-like [Stegodyphus dumicola]
MEDTNNKMKMSIEENTSSRSDTSSSDTFQPLSKSESPTIFSDPKMAGIFTGAIRKMTSGSSTGSSENTPLLNGSQEGPCYAYSFVNNSGEPGVEASQSSLRSSDTQNEEKKKLPSILKNAKLVVIMAVMIFCVVSLCFFKVHEGTWNTVAFYSGQPAYLNVTEQITFPKEIVHLVVKGPFLPGEYYSLTRDFVRFQLYKISENGTRERISKTWTVLLSPESHENNIDSIAVAHDFNLGPHDKAESKTYQLVISTNRYDNYVSMSVNLSVRPKLPIGQVIVAVCVLIGLYILIIFELVHRTLAAMVGATTAISCLALFGERPSLDEVLSWVDVETLSLLFGMMVLVSILCETGFFDYVAVLTYRIARGKVWPLITGLCLVTAVLSAFLDNVTTTLLMSAVAIRLCEAMNIDPKHMLISMVIFSNIGGTATPIGDPPNVIIISNKKISAAGIGFSSFTVHMLPAVVLCLAATYILIRIMYRDMSTLRFSEPPEVVELKHEIEVWKKAYSSLSGYSRDEDTVRAILRRKITVLETLLRKKLYDSKISEDDYKASLKELTSTFKVKNSSLLLKSGIVIGIVIIFFFLESIPQLNLSIGWIAILGAICLLVLADFDELESVLNRVEWSTLLFFAALFVVMEALSRLELVWYIVNMTQDAINAVEEEHRLLVAVVLVLWISALSSSIIDNIPFTTVMIQVVTDIANNAEMKLPLQPLVYALALGACLGGNLFLCATV